MMDFNKRRIVDICRECVSNLELSEDFTLESRSDLANHMLILGNDVSDLTYNEYDLKRLERYN